MFWLKNAWKGELNLPKIIAEGNAVFLTSFSSLIFPKTSTTVLLTVEELSREKQHANAIITTYIFKNGFTK